MSRPLFAHVGCSKTGTSSLQQGLWRSVAELEEAGVGIPFVGRSQSRRRLLDPFGWHPAKGFVGPWDDAALDGTTSRLRRAPGQRLLVSNEDLVELGPDAIGRLVQMSAAAGLDLHLVVTLRDWAQQIPSEYQQFLRHGMAETFPDFIRQVKEREGRWGEHFWRRQDPLDILERWTAAVDPSRVNFVVVPSFSVDPEGVFRMMGELIGVDPAAIHRPAHAVNTSHGVVEAEVFRRVNAALPASFDDYSDAYKHLIRLPFSKGLVLPTEASSRIALPDSDLAWVESRARDVIAEIRARGCVVLGDLDGLLPSAARTAPYAPADDAEVARVAVDTIARFAEMTRRLLAERDEAPAAAAPADATVETPVRRRRGALRR